MIYDNITYPLDKIYSKATGVSYPVCAAGHDNAQPTPDPEPTSIYGDLVIEPYSGENYDFTASMQCSQAMDSSKIYHFYYAGADNAAFDLYLVVDEEDNTKLVLDQHNDSQMLEVNPGDNGTVTEAGIIDKTTWESEQITDTINWSYVGL